MLDADLAGTPAQRGLMSGQLVYFFSIVSTETLFASMNDPRDPDNASSTFLRRTVQSSYLPCNGDFIMVVVDAPNP